MNSSSVSLERTEAPALLLERAALALHVVLPLPGVTEAYPDCPDFRSMELDLLSFGFQVDPPFGSQCEVHEPVPLLVRFPDVTGYQSEGRTMRLACAAPQRRVEVLVSSTAFRDSGFKVWHFIFKPASGERFTEFDLIKLIHLYDGRTEATTLRDTVSYDLPGSTGLKGGELLARLAGASKDVRWQPVAGTVQILTGGELDRVLDTVRKARAEGGEENRKLRDWVARDTSEAAMLKACCGIITGIFDFDQLDDEEILDTLEPTFECSHLIRLHRCTLVSISEADRAMEECWESIGMSPYLLIPHAVLLNNEALVNRADRAIGEVLGRKRAGIHSLERARSIASQSLQRDFLPNVFNYVTERSLLHKGWESRGGEDKRRQTLRRFEELETAIEVRWTHRREHGQIAVASLLALLSVLQVRDVVFEAMGPRVPPLWAWINLGGLALILVLLIFAFSRAGIRS